MRTLADVAEEVEEARRKALQRLQRKRRTARSPQERAKLDRAIRVLRNKELAWPLASAFVGKE